MNFKIFKDYKGVDKINIGQEAYDISTPEKKLAIIQKIMVNEIEMDVSSKKQALKELRVYEVQS